MFPLLDIWIWLLIVLLSIFGTALNYAKFRAGGAGLDQILERYPHLKRERLERIIGLFDRHGPVILLLSSIPGLGTIVPLAAGAFGFKESTFIFWVAIAKLLRWWLLAIIVVGGFTLLFGD